MIYNANKIYISIAVLLYGALSYSQCSRPDVTDIMLKQCPRTLPVGATSTFDLDAAKSDIVNNISTTNPISDYTVKFYRFQVSADDDRNALSGTSAHNSRDAVLFARITKNSNTISSCYVTSKVTLKVEKIAISSPLDMQSCKGQSSEVQYDLAAQSTGISTTNTVTFYDSDPNMASANIIPAVSDYKRTLPLGYTTGDVVQIIHYRVDNGVCHVDGTFRLKAITLPGKGKTITAIEQCPMNIGGNTSEFDLSAKTTDINTNVLDNGDRVSSIYLFSDATKSDESSNTAYSSGAVKMGVLVRDRNSKCTNTLDFDLTLISKPVLNNVNIGICGNPSSPKNFNLTNKNQDIIGTGESLSAYTFEYYQNNGASGLQNKIMSSSSYSGNNNEVVYVKATKGNCFTVAEITLKIIGSIGLGDVTYTACANPGETEAIFDLSSKKSEVLLSNPLNKYDVVYYTDFSAPNSGGAPLGNSYRSAGGKFILVRAIDKVYGCTSDNFFTLEVEQKPTVATIASLSQCPTVTGGSTSEFDLSSKTSDINTNVLSGGDSVSKIYLSTDASKTDESANGSYGSGATTMTAEIVNSNNKCPVNVNFDLTLISKPVLNNVNMGICGNSSSSKIFNLTSKNQDIIGTGELLTAYTFEYYQNNGARGLQNKIASPNGYIGNNNEVVYIKAAKGNCFTVAEITLKIIDIIRLGDVTYTACVNPGETEATFDLSSKKSEVLLSNPLNKYDVVYYVDLGAANSGSAPLGNSYRSTGGKSILVRAIDKVYGCTSDNLFSLEVEQKPTVAAIASISQCATDIGGNTSQFDLSSKTGDVNNNVLSGGDSVSKIYLSTDAGKTDQSTVGSYSSGTATMTAEIVNSNNKCPVNANFDLIINPEPALTAVTIETCETASNSSFGVFDLTSKNLIIIGGTGNISDYDFKYYTREDEAKGIGTILFTSLITTPTSYSSLNGNTVYVRVSNNTGNTCPYVVGITLNTKSLSVPRIVTYDICGTAGSTTGDFTLSSKNADVLPLGATLADYTLSYHAAELDAKSGTNPLADSYTSGSAKIYVRVEKTSGGCPATQEFNLNYILPPGDGKTILKLVQCETTASSDRAEFDLSAKTTDINTNVLGNGDKVSKIYLSTDATKTDESGNSAYSSASVTMRVLVSDANDKCTNTIDFLVDVEQRPQVRDIVLRECPSSPASTTSVFDLDLAKSRIVSNISFTNTISNYTIKFYTSQADADADTGALTGTNAHISADAVLFARITKNSNTINNCYVTSKVTLSVTALSVTNPTDMESCENQSSEVEYDLSAQSSAISTVNTVTFYDADPNMASANIIPTRSDYRLTLPSGYTTGDVLQEIYYRVGNNGTGCSVNGTFKLQATTLPGKNKVITAIEQCPKIIGSNTSEFDLSAKTTDINTNVLSNGDIVSSIYLSSDTTKSDESTNMVYSTRTARMEAVIRDSNSRCTNTLDFDLTVNSAPVLTSVTMSACETIMRPFGDNFGVFDLTSKNLDIIGGTGNVSDYDFKYYLTHTDAIQNNVGRRVVSPNNYEGGSGYILYVNASGKASNVCSSVTSIRLITHPVPVLRRVDYDLCGVPSSTRGLFTLSSKNADVLPTGATLADYTLSYHATESEAKNGTSALADSYVSGSAKIYVRVEAPGGCSVTEEFNLNYINIPGNGKSISRLIKCETTASSNRADFDLLSKKANINTNVLSGGDKVSKIYLSTDAGQTDESGNSAYNSDTATMSVLVSDANDKCTNTIDFVVDVEQRPEVVNITLSECPTIPRGTTSVFDLDAAKSRIVSNISATNFISNYTIKFYTSQAAADADGIPLTRTSAYTSNSIVIYARITDNRNTINSCYVTSQVILSVQTLSVTMPTDMESCENQSSEFQYDLSAQSSAISSNTVTFYDADPSMASANIIPTRSDYRLTLPSGYTTGDVLQTIYYRVGNSRCNIGGTFKLTGAILPGKGKTIADIEKCPVEAGGNMSDFTLRSKKADINNSVLSNGDKVTKMYLSTDVRKLDKSENITYSSSTVTMTTLISDASDKCTNTIDFNLTVPQGPVLTPVTMESCDSATGLFSGPSAFFDLTSKNLDIIGGSGNVSDYDFKYLFTNDDARKRPGATSATPSNNYETISVTIYVRVSDNTGNLCPSVTQMALNVKPLPVPRIVTYDICGAAGSRTATFTLSSKNAEVLPLGATLSDYRLSYHATELEAKNGTNPLADSYTSGSAKIYVRVEKISDGCPTTQEFNLNYIPPPGDGKTILKLVQCETTASSDRAEFDLSAKTTDINTNVLGNGDKVSKIYLNTDVTKTDESGNSTYSSNTATMRVLVSDANDKCTNTIDFLVDVEQRPEVMDITLQECPNTGTTSVFNLDVAKSNIIKNVSTTNPVSDYTIKFYTSQANADADTGALTVTNAHTSGDAVLFARITKTTGTVNNCYVTSRVTLNISAREVIKNNITYTLCEGTTNDEANFDLTSKQSEILDNPSRLAANYTFTYYTAPNIQEVEKGNGIEILTPNNYSSKAKDIYFKISSGTSTICNTYGVINLVVRDNTITYTAQDAYACGGPTATRQDFDLNSHRLSEQLRANITNTQTLTFHETIAQANSGTSDISTNSSYDANSQKEIYARLTDVSGSCYLTSSFKLIVQQVDVNAIEQKNPVLESCDENQDGYALFDLTEIENTIGVANAGYKYYSTKSDAQSEINEITAPYDYLNKTVNREDVYARVAVGNSCIAYVKISLKIKIVAFNKPTNYTVCQPPVDDYVLYDLTTKEAEIRTDPNHTVRFYGSYNDATKDKDDYINVANYKVVLPNTFDRNTRIETVYYRLEDPTGCSKVGFFYLKVFPTEPALSLIKITDIEECELSNTNDIASFNIYDKAKQIRSQLTKSDNLEKIYNLTTRNQDLSGEQDYHSYGSTIYAEIKNVVHGCVIDVDFELIVNLAPTLENSAVEYNNCEDVSTPGKSSFDLDSQRSVILGTTKSVETKYELTYFETESDAKNNALSITNTSNYITDNARIYVRSIDNTQTSNCPGISYIDLVTNATTPIYTIPNYEICGNASTGNDFDLKSYRQVIINNNNTDLRLYDLSLHTSAVGADNKTSDVSLNTAFNSRGQTIYARLENKVTGCYNVSTFDLALQSSSNLIKTPSKYRSCTDIGLGAPYIYDLTTKEVEIVSNPTNYTIVYYRTFADATSSKKQIRNPTTYSTIKKEDKVFVKLKANNGGGAGCEEIIGIELEYAEKPVVNSIEAYECKSNNLRAVFDLTSLTDKITSNVSHIVTYHNSMSSVKSLGSTGIANPDKYETQDSNLFSRVVDPSTGCFSTVGVSLNVIVESPSKKNRIITDDQCEEEKIDGQAKFDLNALVTKMTTTSGAVVGFYNNRADAFDRRDQIPTAVIQGPNRAMVARTDYSKGCYALDKVRLRVVSKPLGDSQVTDITYCSTTTNQAKFDLAAYYKEKTFLMTDSSSYNTTIHENQQDSQQNINGKETETEYLSSTNTMYLRASHKTANCVYVYPFDLNVKQSPLASNPVDLEKCEDFDQRATAVFDLSVNRQAILGNNLSASKNSITYYESEMDARAEVNSITQPQEIDYRAQRAFGNNNNIYVKVINLETKCDVIKSFKYSIRALPPIKTPTLLSFCDVANKGNAVFDLEKRKSDILNGLSADKYRIDYFKTKSNANSGSPVITNAQKYLLTQARETIYFKVSNSDNNRCDIIVPIDLALGSKPALNSNIDIYGCVDNIGNSITFNLQDYSNRISTTPDKQKFEYYDTKNDAENRKNRVSDEQTINAKKDLYLRVINKLDEKCYQVTPMKLDVAEKPIIPTTASNVFEQCDDDEYWSMSGVVNFDLSNKTPEIQGSYSTRTHRVIYYTGKNTQGKLTGKLGYRYVNKINPGRLYAELEDITTGCTSQVDFPIKVIGPILRNNVILFSCNGDSSGKAVFDLTDSQVLLSNDNANETFVYYTEKRYAQAGGTQGKITTPTAYKNQIADAETIYVRVEKKSGGSGCVNVAPVRLFISKTPKVNVLTDVSICSASLDNSQYNLLNKEAEILGSQKPQDVTITFYGTDQDKLNDTNRLPVIYQLPDGTTSMYSRLTNNDTGCYSFNSYNITKVDNGAISDIDKGASIIKESCNSEFDLSSYDDQESGILPKDLEVSYYLSVNDAVAEKNKIINTRHYIASKEDIYKRIFNKNIGCPYFQKYTLESNEYIAPNLRRTTLEECDNDVNKDEITAFDLKKVQSRLSSNYSLLTFEYFLNEQDAKNRSDQITQISNYTNTTKTRQKLYVYSENTTTGCNEISDFYIQVSRVPKINRTNIGIQTCSNNDDQIKYGIGRKNFDLNEVKKEIVGTEEKQSDFRIDFYTSDVGSKKQVSNLQVKDTYVNRVVPVDNIYSNVLYEITGCYEYIPVELTVFDTPILQQNYELKICNETPIYQFDTNRDFDPVFNDNGTNETVSYYNNKDDADKEINAILSFANKSPRETKFVRAINNTSKCLIVEPFVAIVNLMPDVVEGVVLTQCDDELEDGKSLFNLRNADHQVRVNNQDEINYYPTNIDAQRKTNLLDDLYTNIVNNQKIYARVTNAKKCTTVAALNLYISKSILSSKDKVILEACDDLSVDGDDTNGISRFNLKLSEDKYKQRLAGLGIVSDYDINFYATQKESVKEENPKEKENYLNTIPNLETLYIRITEQKTKRCITNKEILTLLVNPLPKYNPAISDNIFCSEGRENPVLGVDLGKDIKYEWNTGETTPMITPAKEGSYTIKYTNERTGCTHTSDPINLELSSIPKVLNVEVETFRTRGKITVTAQGDGIASYVYKMDENLQFLDNPVIDDLSVGKHILTVKDVNGCGESLKEVFITGYSDYMTPNSDGINDTWTLRGLEKTKNPIVRIYDRHNSLLIEFNPIDEFWDGTFRGQKMPSDDYWFEAIYTDVDTNKEDTMSGHFALKR